MLTPEEYRRVYDALSPHTRALMDLATPAEYAANYASIRPGKRWVLRAMLLFVGRRRRRRR